MINIGRYNDLTILRHTSVGLYLGDQESDEDVLLPNKYVPEDYIIGDNIEVFVYRDFEERKVATNITPKILLREFALLKAVSVSEVGAFMDWGLEKDLMVPHREQRQKMVEGRWYVIYLDIDEKTDRLFGSNKLERFLQNDILRVEHGDEVEVIVTEKTDLGYNVIVDNVHKGLIYQNEVFKELHIGDKFNAFVKKIREGNKIDISIQPIGYEQFNDVNSQLIYNRLSDNGGFLPVNDKSTPDDIYSRFGISKKAFKKAVGALYKDRKITIEDNGIKLV